MAKVKKMFLLGLMALVPAACSEQQAGTGQEREGAQTILRQVDFAQVSRGGVLFAKHCAECHGDNAQGAVNWRQRDAEGMFPPPPLNGTGHAWHHPQSTLFDVIKEGSPVGMGRMPAWKGRLSDEEITAIIAWFQSRWTDEVFAAWYQTDQRAKAGL